jgi:hypothetical protein
LHFFKNEALRATYSAMNDVSAAERNYDALCRQFLRGFISMLNACRLLILSILIDYGNVSGLSAMAE